MKIVFFFISSFLANKVFLLPVFLYHVNNSTFFCRIRFIIMFFSYFALFFVIFFVPFQNYAAKKALGA